MDNTKESQAGEAAPVAANKDNTTNSGDAGRMVGPSPASSAIKQPRRPDLTKLRRYSTVGLDRSPQNYMARRPHRLRRCSGTTRNRAC